MDGNRRRRIGRRQSICSVLAQSERSRSFATTGKPNPDSAALKSIGMQRGATGSEEQRRTDMEKLPPAIPGQEASSQRSTARLNSRKTLILQRQRILFSAFRSDQYSDPEGYLASLGIVLEQYPDDVILYITDPRTGVQRACKWPPTISEIVEACDRRMQDQARVKRLQNWGKNEVLALEAPRDERPTYEQLKEKYGDNFGLDPNAG